MKTTSPREQKLRIKKYSRLANWSVGFLIAALVAEVMTRVLHWPPVVETIAGAVVAGSVFGEWWFHRLESKASDALLQRLEKKLEPRRLSQEQREEIRAAISGFPETHINVVSVAEDKESERFAEDFVEVFTTSGWRATATKAIRAMGVGIVILVAEREGPLALAAATLQQVLSAQELGGRPLGSGSGDRIDMIVGTKATATIDPNE